ncbi:hypothetical protein EVAR_6304_1 [Eumeta japonica]|uniref:Uncharacterized protein n=1 Tax=Eumeta variegata TaxID=151549 RepID=A0A4C1TB03_EUMVA|nr:hypothetical protein EVAR_6304_1 [Eumeta japonica]
MCRYELILHLTGLKAGYYKHHFRSYSVKEVELRAAQFVYVCYQFIKFVTYVRSIISDWPYSQGGVCRPGAGLRGPDRTHPQGYDKRPHATTCALKCVPVRVALSLTTTSGAFGAHRRGSGDMRDGDVIELCQVSDVRSGGPNL